jgi:hypothetical protein
MAKVKKYRYFAADFETTVFEGQTTTEVWSSASVELYTEDVQIFHSIEEQLQYFESLDCNIIAYYHNLKFDGSFWLDYLLRVLKYKQANEQIGDQENEVTWLKDNEMPPKSFKYSISDKGMWYTIVIRTKNKRYIELRDSLKLLPFSIKRIGESFKTKHKKLEMEYKGFRYAGCDITDEEKEYIANDVLVLKEALEFMYNEGHDKLTIGSCCLSEYKNIITKEAYEAMYPNVYDIPIDPKRHNYSNAGDWIRHSYKGGWCYLVKGKENKIYTNGTTADVNSLYPSMMSSESGNFYPVGKPKFWTGNFIPPEAKEPRTYYFVRIKTRFYIKPDKLPFIQIKGSHYYSGTEALETSDIRDPKTGRMSAFFSDADGKILDTRVELTLTMTDYVLFREHYDVIDFEILDGCYFGAKIGIFDEYINKYAELKKNSKGAMRELAKLFLNNLYGKMASSEDSSFKLAYLRDDNTIGFEEVREFGKTPGYIPVGSAITSYARNFTIRAAQANYHGKDKAGFIYADTDSIHCDLKPDDIVGIRVHDKNFCCWKLESCWDRAIFARQKTYIEHVVAENLEKIDEPYNNIKCAGMPQRCKDLFEKSMKGDIPEKEECTPELLEFFYDKNGNKIIRDFSDFKIGLKVPGKLMPKRIVGGTLLVETSYQMR